MSGCRIKPEAVKQTTGYCAHLLGPSKGCYGFPFLCIIAGILYPFSSRRGLLAVETHGIMKRLWTAMSCDRDLIIFLGLSHPLGR
jgi:hypothetical protein